MELKCFAWAQALVTLVYGFIQRETEKKPVGWKTSLPIPTVQFVYASLAIKQNGKDNVYMVEEKIPGEFEKVIHNGSAKPLIGRLHQEADVTIACFLAFTQHVQYLKTGKLAFIGDYQGKYLPGLYMFIAHTCQEAEQVMECSSCSLILRS